MSLLRSLVPFFLVFLLFLGPKATAQTLLKVGDTPDGTRSAAQAERWILFLQQREIATELSFHFVTPPDLLAFHQRLANDAYLEQLLLVEQARPVADIGVISVRKVQG